MLYNILPVSDYIILQWINIIYLLDYGLFEDRINDTLYKTFSAYELQANFLLKKK